MRKNLAEHVTRMLDVLPDLASRFELLIVDDGSTDQTEEVAHELAINYPQLSATRHPRRLGPNAAAQTALAKTSGDLVVLHESSEETANEPRRIAELRRTRTLPLVATADPLRFLQDPPPAEESRRGSREKTANDLRRSCRVEPIARQSPLGPLRPNPDHRTTPAGRCPEFWHASWPTVRQRTLQTCRLFDATDP